MDGSESNSLRNSRGDVGRRDPRVHACAVGEKKFGGEAMKAFGIVLSLAVALVITFAATKEHIIFTVEEVANIYDGDTFTIIHEGAKQRVRFRGVDTPELKDPQCEAERVLARKAKEFVVTRVRAAQRVTLLDLDKTGDKYGRWLAWVFLDGESLAAMTIAAELGRPYDGGARQS